MGGLEKIREKGGEMGENREKWGGRGGTGGGGGDGEMASKAHGMWVVEDCGRMWSRKMGEK